MNVEKSNSSVKYSPEEEIDNKSRGEENKDKRKAIEVDDKLIGDDRDLSNAMPPAYDKKNEVNEENSSDNCSNRTGEMEED